MGLLDILMKTLSENAFRKRFQIPQQVMIKSKPNRQPTILDVAQHAGVSISTVSRVLNQSAPVSEGKSARVLQAVEALNFRPRAAARILASRRTDTIGLLLPIISGEFFAAMLRGIERGVLEGGYDLLIHSTFLESRPQAPFKHILGEHNTDGLIVFSDSLENRELERLHDLRFPVVLLHRSSPEGLNIPSITVENKNGARKITEHLITVHNRRRIVYLRGPEGHEDTHWREIGYRQALDNHGIDFDPSLIGEGNFNDQDAQDTIASMLVDGLEFDAVFAGDDEAASGVLRSLRWAGIKVPEMVSVVGFDDSNLAGHLVPQLTTVNAHIEDAGYAAAQQLVKLINTGEAAPITLLPTELVIRRSCGCSFAE
jgi:LacI family transcriptional regulator